MNSQRECLDTEQLMHHIKSYHGYHQRSGNSGPSSTLSLAPSALPPSVPPSASVATTATATLPSEEVDVLQDVCQKTLTLVTSAKASFEKDRHVECASQLQRVVRLLREHKLDAAADNDESLIVTASLTMGTADQNAEAAYRLRMLTSRAAASMDAMMAMPPTGSSAITPPAAATATPTVPDAAAAAARRAYGIHDNSFHTNGRYATRRSSLAVLQHPQHALSTSPDAPASVANTSGTGNDFNAPFDGSTPAPLQRAARSASNESQRSNRSSSSHNGPYAAASKDPTALKAPLSPVFFLLSSELFVEAAFKAHEALDLIRDMGVAPATTNLAGEKDTFKWSPISKINPRTGHGAYYRQPTGLDTHCFKVLGEVDADITSVATVLCELDVFKEWFPMCWYSKENGRLNDMHRYATFTISCPWPVANRSVFLGGFSIDLLNEMKKVVVVARTCDPSIHNVPLGVRPPKHDPKEVVCDMKRCGYILEPLPGARTLVSFGWDIDIRLKNVPQPLLNWVSAKIIWVLLAKIGATAKKASKPGSIYDRRRANQPAFYQYMRLRTRETLSADELPEDEREMDEI